MIVGTFAALSPSYMVGAQALLMDNNYEPNYGMNSYDYKQSYGKDNNYDKSKDNSVTVKKIKCNNINVNLNGFSGNEIGASTTSAVGALATQVQAEDEGANGANSGNDGRGGDGRTSGSDTDSRFVCINNNNNVVEPSAVEECAEAEDIETCFANAEFMDEGGFPAFVTALESGITIEINGQDITLRSFEDICLAFEGLTTYEQLAEAVNEILMNAGVHVGEGFFAVVNCLAEAIGIPIPPDNI